MKLKFVLFSLFIFFNLQIFSYDPFNDLVIVLMVKNEEKVMRATLKDFVESELKSYFIFDTGSTDKTIKVTQDYFNEKGIKSAYIMQEPFIDFATSRNRALQLAEEKFPNATFILMLDAEWYINNTKGLIEFCKQHVDEIDVKSYSIRIVGNIDFWHCRLFRTKSGIQFVGAVHEVPNIVTRDRLPRDIYFEYRPSEEGGRKSVKRFERDKELLLKSYNDDPNNSRTTFYLAQTYHSLNDLINAYKYYEIRSKQPGWDEENYETFYRLGNITADLCKTNNNFNWAMAFDYYTTAYKMRPHRAEPLIKIAEHYWPTNIPLCFIFAKRAMDFPYPENELLFVDKWIYDYYRYALVSMSAWWVGEYDLGEIATRKAMQVAPNVLFLYQNLVSYLERKKDLKK